MVIRGQLDALATDILNLEDEVRAAGNAAVLCGTGGVEWAEWRDSAPGEDEEGTSPSVLSNLPA